MAPVIFVILSALNIYNGGLKGDYNILFIYAILAIISIIYMPIHFDKRFMKNAKNQLDKPESQAALGKYIIIFDGDNITFKYPNSEYETTWEKISHVNSSENYFFIYTTPRSCFIVPKLKVAKQADELERIIKENMG
jgi:hypothetical protein